ncbi:M14 family metallopeptidase [Streptomyces orinoci]|uniref:M14 family zinc carboxypeptidase n=1 Tax=Streptomyces orinoci TaxID=67339 RepID=A0ABV3JYQ3_STRON|nr:M14 family metallopeptidase [Streptomyces orinoci]
MRRRARAVLATASLLVGGLAAAPTTNAQPAGDGGSLLVWQAKVTRAQIPVLLKAGVDGEELGQRPGGDRAVDVELYLTQAQARALRGQGVQLAEKKTPQRTLDRLKAQGDGVFRKYGGPGGLKQEIADTGRAHPSLTKVVSIGKTLKGQDILALKLTKNARHSRDGSKPSVLYLSNQHAREWITPEMTRRLMHYYLDRYGKDRRITRIVDSTELWFVLSANPDGYDYTFQGPGTRLWRKNLRDNDGDGKLGPNDGVDLNRNFPYKWGYDDEGSSPDPSAETYRGKSPGSEPETRAMDAFEKRVHFTYAVNYHSAAELLLYGVGWQVGTSTPDDVLYRALAGTPQKSAIPGYHPELSSELYTTNGEADGHAANVNGTLMFTPEMSTCQTASRTDTSGHWNPADCPSVFSFPDDEKLIQAEFAKNVPFALSVAETAPHADRPSSSVGLDAPDFTPDTFKDSFARDGDQPVAVTARKSLRDKRLNYRIDGGHPRSVPLKPWKGGKRYGGRDNLRFDQYRATVKGGHQGSRVQVWFTGRTAQGRATRSEPFTYTVWHRPPADTLVIADEGGPARQLTAYTEALAAAGRRAVVWDVAKQGAPSALGVLSHFRTAVWYSGAANRPDGQTVLAVRDFLNEGGKLITAGKRAGGDAQVGPALTDDFSQYYLGAYSRTALERPRRFAGSGGLAGVTADLADAPGNPLDAAGSFVPTSEVLKPGEFPQFRSAAAGSYPGLRTPLEPYRGEWMAAARHRDSAWMRLSRTIDLTGARPGDKPSLGFQLSYGTEPDYDNVVVEAHTAGQDDWTTLPEAGGATRTDVPADCPAYLKLHPFLKHYLTVSGDKCLPKGSSGSWNRFTGQSGGWHPVSFDLGAFAGRKAEVVVSYITDPAAGGPGVLIDEAALSSGGRTEPAEGFESSLGAWTVPGAPPGSPGNTGDWARSQALSHSSAAVTTKDTVLFGFGLEQIRDLRQRAAVLHAALRALHS